jgi:HEAT repeat protein
VRFFGPPDVETLLARADVRGLSKALRSRPDAWVRRDASRALAQLGGPDSAAALLAALDDDVRTVRMEAALGLGKIGDVRAVDALADAVDRKRSKEARAAMDVAVALGPPAVAPLARTLRHNSWAARAWAAEALGRIGDAAAVAPLAETLGDQCAIVRDNAADALVLLWGSVSQSSRSATLAPVRSLLDHADGVIRATAADVLRRIGDPVAAACLIQHIETAQDPEAGTEAVEALIGIGDPTAAGPLLVFIRHRADGSLSAVADRLEETLGRSPDLGEVTALYRVLRGQWQKVNDVSVLRACLESDYELYEAARAYCFATGAPTRLDEIDPLRRDPEYEWLVNGCVAMVLIRLDAPLDEVVADRSERALQMMSEKYREELDALCRTAASGREPGQPVPQLGGTEEKLMRPLFGDYARLIQAAISTGWPPAPDAVDNLCRIETPTATNLLHHLCTTSDLSFQEVVDVPYDLDHPSGTRTITRVRSFSHVREAALAALAARGNPSYDLAVYRQPDGWRIPDDVERALDWRFRR